MSTQGTESPPPPEIFSLMIEPRVITAVNTGYGFLYILKSIMKLFSLHGELKKNVLFKSVNMLQNIAMTSSGDLVYSDEHDKAVNIVKNRRTQG